MDTIKGIAQPGTGGIAEAGVRRTDRPAEAGGTEKQRQNKVEAQQVTPGDGKKSTVAALSRSQVEELVSELAAAMDELAPDPRSISFRHDEETSDFVIEIADRNTGEMITQFPPEKILNMREHLDELVGMVVDRKI